MLDVCVYIYSEKKEGMKGGREVDVKYRRRIDIRRKRKKCKGGRHAFE